MGFTCPHTAKSISASGEVYCLRCGLSLGFACSFRPCGCPADPFVFGHLCIGSSDGLRVSAPV